MFGLICQSYKGKFTRWRTGKQNIDILKIVKIVSTEILLK